MTMFRLRNSLMLALLAMLPAGCGVFAQAPAAEQVPAPSEKDVVYGVAGDEKLLLDVYRCDTPGPHPALLLIHGGAWRGGSKSGEGRLASLATQAGIVCFAVEYRFAPKHRFPAQVEDCARAARWVRAHAAEYDVDPDRLAAWGASAGGHLSLMLGFMEPDAYQTADDPNKALSAKVRCVVDVFGPVDMTGAREWPEAAVQLVTDFIGASPQAAPEKWAEASPITHLSADDPPVMMIHGDKDSLVPLEQSEALKAALDKLSLPNELIVIKNGEHGFGGADFAEVVKAVQRGAQWVLEHTRPREAPVAE